MLAGIDLITGQVHALVKDRHRSREFIEFLKLLDAAYPSHTAIKLILDNHSAHISKETRAWLAKQPAGRFEFTFTPKHGSWLNLIEGFFSKLARSVLRHIRVASAQELKNRIMAGMDHFNRDPVVGEMKQSFTPELVLQAVDRASACDEVWLAVGASKRGRGRENDARVKKLYRFLGFGLLTVTAEGRVDVVAEPAPWKPRRDAKRRSRIVEEHHRRKGDPVVGGSTRAPQMTAYRQQALAVAHALAGTPCRPRDLRTLAPEAAKILQGMSTVGSSGSNGGSTG